MLHKICALRRHIHEPIKVRNMILLLGVKTLEANRIGQLGGCLLASDGGEALVQLGIKEHPSVPAVGVRRPLCEGVVIAIEVLADEVVLVVCLLEKHPIGILIQRGLHLEQGEGRIVHAELIKAVLVDLVLEIGKPLKKNLGILALHVVVLVVAIEPIGVMEGKAALHGFQIVAAATRGAGINKDAVLLNDGIPQSQIALDVLVFGHALAVAFVGGCPSGGGIVVKVLTVARDTRSIDDLADLGKDPLTALGIAEVDDAALEPASFGYT